MKRFISHPIPNHIPYQSTATQFQKTQHLTDCFFPLSLPLFLFSSFPLFLSSSLPLFLSSSFPLFLSSSLPLFLSSSLPLFLFSSLPLFLSSSLQDVFGRVTARTNIQRHHVGARFSRARPQKIELQSIGRLHFGQIATGQSTHVSHAPERRDRVFVHRGECSSVFSIFSPILLFYLKYIRLIEILFTFFTFFTFFTSCSPPRGSTPSWCWKRGAGEAGATAVAATPPC